MSEPLPENQDTSNPELLPDKEQDPADRNGDPTTVDRNETLIQDETAQERAGLKGLGWSRLHGLRWN